MATLRSKLKTAGERGFKKPDYILSILIALMVLVGLVMISSASVVMSRNVAGVDNFYFFSQLKAAAVGFFLLYIVSRIDYRIWSKYAKYLLIGNIILLIMVFIPHIGFGYGGANRWIKIGPIFLGQPSEFIKLTLILYLSSWFENKGNDIKNLWLGTAPFAALIGVIVFLVMKQPDMGTTSVLAVTAGVIYFVAGASYVHIAGMLSVGVAGLIVLIKTAPYRMARLMIFLNPASDQSGTGYHINQALLAVGSGGLFGVGFGRSIQKFNYLPEAATDSIFAIISEELGLIRASLVIVLFIAFAMRGYKIAKNAPDVFSRLVASGITTWIVAQAFINIMAILSMIPLTGVPLPFISYGGSSLVTLLIATGILLNISRNVKQGEADESFGFGGRVWRPHFTRSRRRLSV
jgi:cell division protein FtsW